MKNTYFWLAIIVLLAGVLRFYHLGSNPPSLTWDEAAWGYNAYSIGIDGRDEFGQYLPLAYIESFGDFKPPLYAYLTIIPVTLFGLTPFAVRFASALFGTLTVAVVYYLVKEIMENSHPHERVSLISLTTAFLVSISPWHINLSRAAFEANVASFFLVTGVWLFLTWSSRKGSFWIVLCSGISFVLSLYTFNTARIVTPLLVMVLSVRFYKTLRAKYMHVITAAVICFVISIPYVLFAMTPQARLRYHEVNIFSDAAIVESANRSMARSARWVCERSGGSDCSEKTALDAPVWARVLYNRRWGFTRAYIKHYFDHFNPSFLFIRGDGNPKFSTQDVGQLYLISAPFLVIGLLQLIRERKGLWWFALLWLAIGIAPAATARETPHALRIETTIPTFQMLTAYGIVWAYYAAKTFHPWVRRGLFAGVAVSYAGMMTYYLHGYHVHYPVEYSGEWQYGYEEAISFVQNSHSYDRVVMTNALGRPYAYVLFYTKTHPSEFRSTARVERETLGFVHVTSFGNYTFSDTPSAVSSSRNTVYIDVPNMVPEKVRVVKEFMLRNGEKVLVAYER